MKTLLKITEATGKSWELELSTATVYSIGRAQENNIVLNDRRVSRRHAQIIAENGGFKLIDGYFVGGEIQRSVNRVFVNGQPQLEKILEPGDLITIGASRLEFERVEESQPPPPEISIEKNAEVITDGHSGGRKLRRSAARTYADAAVGERNYRQ